MQQVPHYASEEMSEKKQRSNWFYFKELLQRMFRFSANHAQKFLNVSHIIMLFQDTWEDFFMVCEKKRRNILCDMDTNWVLCWFVMRNWTGNSEKTFTIKLFYWIKKTY